MLFALCLATVAHGAGYVRWEALPLPPGDGRGILELACGADHVVAAIVDGRGAFRSDDQGNHWTPLDGLTAPCAVAVSPADANVMLAAETGGGLLRSADGGRTWTRVSDGAVASLLFAPAAPTLALAGAQAGKALLVSHDAGLTWTASVLPREVKGQYPLVVDAQRWVMASRVQDGILVTSDAGATWQAGTGDVDYFPGPMPLAQVGEVLFSSKHHGFSKSTDAGHSWAYKMEQHTRMLGAAGEFVFRENRQAIRGTDDRIFTVEMSDNYGQSWSDVTGGLQTAVPAPVHGVLVVANAVDPFAHVRVATAWATALDGRGVYLGLGRAGLYRGRLLWTKGGPLLLAASVSPLSVMEGESGTVLTLRGTATTRRGSVKRVYADLSAIGGGELPLFDDGKHDDGEAGDKIWGNHYTLPQALTAGTKVLGVVAEDDQGRLSSQAVPLAVAGRDEQRTVWDGERFGGGLGWCAPNGGLNFLRAQSEEAHSGKVALELHGEGSGYIGGGWNWYGWWPPEAGDDIRTYRNLSFWAKLIADEPYDFTVMLESNNKEPTGAVSALEYCPELRDGAWHEVVIPLADIYAVKATAFDPRKAWELQIQTWDPHPRSFSLLIDDIGFDNRAARLHSQWVSLPLARTPRALAADAAPVSADIDLDAAGKPISPFIYGASMGDRRAAQEAGLTMLRAGGNGVSPFNWRHGFSSKGADWFYQNDGTDTPPESTWLARFHGENEAAGLGSYLTIPIMGRVAKDGTSVAFDTAKYPDQDSWAGQAQPTDPHPNAGSGRQSVKDDAGHWLLDKNGKRVVRDITANPDDTSVAVTPAEQTEFLRFLIDKLGYGTADKGGIKVVALDNEPMLWQDTHRGMITQPLSYDDFLARTITCARQLKAIDPSVKIAGPTAWGWTAYFYSGLDRALVTQGKGTWEAPPDFVAHGKVPLAKWYLAKLHEEEQRTGQRLLDILDFHFYPQTGIYQAGAPGDAKTMEARVQETRVLWDPTWRDPSWMGQETDHKIALLRMMHAWVDEADPGLQLSLGEYNFGGEQDVSGGVAQAELLGVFAREGLDYAFLWLFPTPNSSQWFAYKLFRNPDGKHTAVGDRYLPSTCSAPEDVSVHTFGDPRDGRVSVVLINKRAAKDARVTVRFTRAVPAQDATVYEYSGADRFSLGQWPARHVEGRAMTLDVPAMSAVRVDVRTR
jgi:photosystem II stability/assembly factor-like uncharacterized protein